MANYTTEILVKNVPIECEKIKDKICSDTLLTMESYEDDHRRAVICNTKEEKEEINTGHEDESSSESDEETVAERKDNASPPRLPSLEKPSEKTVPNTQGLTDSNSQDSDVKPTHSYIALIAMAILSASSKKMILGDIYENISDNFPYYRNKDKSWRNSIRHNLSLNECFIKAGRSENGKGNYWAIHPANLEDFANGDFRRRRARRRVRKSSALKFAGGTAAYLRSLSIISPVHHSGLLPYRTEDYNRLYSHPYVPASERKTLAMEAIMSSYDLPTSLCLSGSTQKSYQPLMSGVSSSERMFQPYTSSSVYPYSSSLGHYAASSQTTPSPEYTRTPGRCFSSAFLPYSTVSGQAASVKSESWQETLSKLQEQLRKAS